MKRSRCTSVRPCFGSLKSQLIVATPPACSVLPKLQAGAGSSWESPATAWSGRHRRLAGTSALSAVVPVPVVPACRSRWCRESVEPAFGVAGRLVLAQLVRGEERQRDHRHDSEAGQRDQPARGIGEAARLAAASAVAAGAVSRPSRRPSRLRVRAAEAGRRAPGSAGRGRNRALTGDGAAGGARDVAGQRPCALRSRTPAAHNSSSSGAAASGWLSPARIRSSRFTSRETSYPQRGPSAISSALRRASGRATREVFRRGHDRAADQRGDDADVAHERGLDLEPHEVVLAVEPALAGAVDDRQPARPDHREQHVARPDRRLDRILELDADVDRVDVHEDVLGPSCFARAS